jgi:hypothetical protein
MASQAQIIAGVEMNFNFSRRIFFSLTADPHLTTEQNDLKWALVKKVTDLGYCAEIFTPPPERRIRGMASRLGWGFEACERVMRRCCGHVVIGMPRWQIQDEKNALFLATEFCQYEAAVSHTLKLPTLIISDRVIKSRLVFDPALGRYIISIPREKRTEWLESERFHSELEVWDEDMKIRPEIFLGYSSQSRGLAKQIKRLLEAELKVRVLDWHDDFKAGVSILSEISSAAERCRGGIFLFTKDDTIEGGTAKAAPRDNVVFEAGYFTSAKGHDRTLIILESGAKMPADLGGYIYASLEDRSNIEPIEVVIRTFLSENF